MKTITKPLFMALVASLMLAACGEEDVDNQVAGDPKLADEQNAAEEAPIPVSTLEQGISVSGATKETGTPPSPSTTMDFSIDGGDEAFQNAGLAIELSSSATVAGAYIQFKEVGGTAADSYFDVPVSSFDAARTRIEKLNQKPHPISNARIKNDGWEIDVDFDQSISAGQFCYDICLYDFNGEVSQIEEVCVEVESWGGNAAIVGEWVYDRYEDTYEDQYDDDYDDDDDYQETIYCDNGETFTVSELYSYESSVNWELNEDGTFVELYESKEEYLDYDGSEESCSAEYEIDEEKYEAIGRWAYNESDETVTIIGFEFKDLIDEEYNEEYEDGELYVEGVKAEIVSNELVLSGTYEYDGETYEWKSYFKRK